MWENTHNFAGLSSIYIERQKAGPLNWFYQSITIPPKEGGNGFAIPPKEGVKDFPSILIIMLMLTK